MKKFKLYKYLQLLCEDISNKYLQLYCKYLLYAQCEFIDYIADQMSFIYKEAEKQMPKFIKTSNQSILTMGNQ